MLNVTPTLTLILILILILTLPRSCCLFVVGDIVAGAIVTGANVGSPSKYVLQMYLTSTGYIGFTRIVRCLTELRKFSASSFEGVTSCALKIVLYFCLLSLSSIISRNRGFSALILKFHLQLTVGVGTLFDGEPEFHVFFGPQMCSFPRSDLSGLIRALRALNETDWGRQGLIPKLHFPPNEFFVVWIPR